MLLNLLMRASTEALDQLLLCNVIPFVVDHPLRDYLSCDQTAFLDGLFKATKGEDVLVEPVGGAAGEVCC